MPGEDYTPSGTFPTFPLSLVKDGEIYNFDSIQKSGDPKKGLFAKLIDAAGYLYNNLSSVVLAAANTWSGNQTFSGKVTFTGQVVPGVAQAVDHTAASVTIDAPTHRTWYVSAPTPSTQTITLKSTSPAPSEGSEIEFLAFGIPNTKNVIVAREDATQIVVMTGGVSVDYGSALCKFIAGKWRLRTAVGETGVVLINDP